MDEKKLEKLHRALGPETVKEMEAMDETTLKKRIVEASQAKAQAAAELEANPNYQQVKSDKSLLEAGKREVNKRQNAVIDLAVHLLEGQGK